MESRVEKVILLFKQGYNCAQSVFAAYADLFGRDSEMSFKLATPFGGGLAGMCEVCGTVSAMCMVAGLAKGTTEPGDKEGKKSCFELVHVLTDKFRQENGSIIRKQLIGLEPCVSVDFKRKLCVEQVRYCAQLFHRKILQPICCYSYSY